MVFLSLSLTYFIMVLKVKLLDHMVVLVLIFCETSILFSVASATICISTNSALSFPLLHTLAHMCCVGL